jgi:Ca2+-binding EF-hand superfamily protein
VSALDHVLKKLCTFEKAHTRIVLDYLGVAIDYNDKIDYAKFKKEMSTFLLDTGIARRNEAIEFMWKTSSTSDDYTILAGKLMEDLKVKLGIIDKADAITAFANVMTGDGSSSLRETNFISALMKFDLANDSFDLNDPMLRENSEKIAKFMFSLINKSKTGSISKEEFVIYIVSIKVSDDAELYVKKYKGCSDIFQKIVDTLRKTKRSFSDKDLFPGLRMSPRIFANVLSTKFDIPDSQPQKNSLARIEKGFRPEKSTNIDLQLLHRVIQYYKTHDMGGNLIENNRNRITSNLDEEEANPIVYEKLQLIKNQIKRLGNFSVVKVFELLGKNNESTLDVRDLKIFLNQFDKKIYTKEAQMIFKMADSSKNGKISMREFAKFFEITDMDSYTNHLSSFAYAKEILREINSR